jgi:hypothetical protein
MDHLRGKGISNMISYVVAGDTNGSPTGCGVRSSGPDRHDPLVVPPRHYRRRIP